MSGSVIGSVYYLRETYKPNEYYEKRVVEIETENEGILYLTFDQDEHMKYTPFIQYASLWSSKPVHFDRYLEKIKRDYPGSNVRLSIIKFKNKMYSYDWGF